MRKLFTIRWKTKQSLAFINPIFCTVVFCVIIHSCPFAQQMQWPQPSQLLPGGFNPFAPQTPSPSPYTRPTLQNFIEQEQIRRNSQQQQILEEVNQEIEKLNRKELEWAHQTRAYHEAYDSLLLLNPDSFSLSKAVFIAENAFYDNGYKYADFQQVLQRNAALVRQVVMREGLSEKNDLALNYGIMKLYRQPNNYYNAQTKQSKTVEPFGYDFEDFTGKRDYSKMFALKALATRKGQCHSLPLIYLMLAEQLHAKAWLSLAPQHSFIQFMDGNNNLLNFETTNGQLVSSAWLQQSGFINANALRMGTFLDTLSSRRLYAQCMVDLLNGFIFRFGDDNYLAKEMTQKILKIDSNNLSANIIKANRLTANAMKKITEAGRPKLKALPNYPDAYDAWQQMQQAYEKVDALGYQDMPREAYNAWLKSINTQQQRQATKEAQQRMQQEMQRLKTLKVTVTNNPRKK
ncbi:hypothetical protein [Pinibacter soli]|uniref:Transglutaminase-like superfamily protein n=1 Tax=Pinibacter soli TaxID=3044211 RepID=A0ABT6RIH9_9BACT|nr:hypothetical protein [Pinibacter soli]MDI3322372.1 hypothetical protein [Pinibacter soli]